MRKSSGPVFCRAGPDRPEKFRCKIWGNKNVRLTMAVMCESECNSVNVSVFFNSSVSDPASPSLSPNGFSTKSLKFPTLFCQNISLIFPGLFPWLEYGREGWVYCVQIYSLGLRFCLNWKFAPQGYYGFTLLTGSSLWLNKKSPAEYQWTIQSQPERDTVRLTSTGETKSYFIVQNNLKWSLEYIPRKFI